MFYVLSKFDTVRFDSLTYTGLLFVVNSSGASRNDKSVCLMGEAVKA